MYVPLFLSFVQTAFGYRYENKLESSNVTSSLLMAMAEVAGSEY